MSSEHARAVFFTGPRQVEVRDVSVELQAEERRVHSRLIGISHGTEMLCYRGQLPQADPEETLSSLPDSFAYPLRYGYINVGVRDDGVRVFAFYPHQDRFAVPDSAMIPLPASVSDEDAVFLASMETALGIVHDAAPRLGEVVALFGCGVIGLLTAVLLQRAGARVVAVEPAALRRRTATELGCIGIDPSTESVTERIREVTTGRGADIAINTSAGDAGLQTAIDVACMEGTVVEASWHGAKQSTLSLGGRFHRRRLSLKSSQVSRLNPELTPRWDKERRMNEVLGLLGEVQPHRLISHRFPMSRADEAFRHIDVDSGETLQVVLDPRQS